ncbi:hypothetical protein [Candidatus Gillettellia adelgis]
MYRFSIRSRTFLEKDCLHYGRILSENNIIKESPALIVLLLFCVLLTTYDFPRTMATIIVSGSNKIFCYSTTSYFHSTFIAVSNIPITSGTPQHNTNILTSQRYAHNLRTLQLLLVVKIVIPVALSCTR